MRLQFDSPATAACFALPSTPTAVVRDYPIRRAEAASQHERFGTPPHGGRPAPCISGSGGPSTGAPSLCERIASPFDGAATSSSATRHWLVAGATPPVGSRAARRRARATRSACLSSAAACSTQGPGAGSHATALPVLRALVRPVKLNQPEVWFHNSEGLEESTRNRLVENFKRMQGTLGFWKKQAAVYGTVHYYCVCWSVPSVALTPVLVQWTSDPGARLLVTVMSAHAALLLTLHKALKVPENYRAFRDSESHYYDVSRRLLDRPGAFGGTEDERLDTYFRHVESANRHCGAFSCFSECLGRAT